MNKRLIVYAASVSAGVNGWLLLVGEFTFAFTGWMVIADIIWAWLSLAVVIILAYHGARIIHKKTKPRKVSE